MFTWGTGEGRGWGVLRSMVLGLVWMDKWGIWMGSTSVEMHARNALYGACTVRLLGGKCSNDRKRNETMGWDGMGHWIDDETTS